MPRTTPIGERSDIESRYRIEVHDGIAYITDPGDYEWEPPYVDYFDRKLAAGEHDRTETNDSGVDTFVFDLTTDERREFPEAGTVVRIRKGAGQKPREV